MRSSDAPIAPLGTGASISSINATTSPITINTSSTSGLVNGAQVTISGVTDQTTGQPAAINGSWNITGVTGTSFQLVGSTATTDNLTGGSWKPTTGTIPYTLNFNPPSTAISTNGISTAQGSPITITTGSTVGLTNGEQVTISGVTPTGGATPINGTWTISNLNTTANTFQLVGITGSGGPTGNGGSYTAYGNWAPADALQFAQTVYDVMQNFSILKDPSQILTRSGLLLSYMLGGNTGTFLVHDQLNPDVNRVTLLPNTRTALQLRDELKSLLRGVYNFNAVPNQALWYPNPATPTPGATLDTSLAQTNPQGITFGIYNLDPFVWFVHDVLHNSSYGFSFDDDVANADSVKHPRIAVGGNTYTASPPRRYHRGTRGSRIPKPFHRRPVWYPAEPGFYDTTSSVAIANCS